MVVLELCVKPHHFITFKYKNYRGEISVRQAIPEYLWFGESDYYSGKQWFLKCWDMDKREERDFALDNIVKEEI